MKARYVCIQLYTYELILAISGTDPKEWLAIYNEFYNFTIFQLMKDQVKNLGQKDIDAKFIQDSFDNTAEDTKVKITSGNYSIILISPELLFSDTSWVYVYHNTATSGGLIG